MANSLYPAFFRIFYHSDRASHVMTVPTREWVGDIDGGLPGEFLNWNDTTIPADTMIEDFAALIAAALWTNLVTLDSYTIYHFLTTTQPPVPVFEAPLDIPGELVSATWAYAVQTTYDWRTAAFGLFKIVSLDGPSGDSFEDNPSWYVAGAGAAMNSFIVDADNAFSGRDNTRPLFPQPYSRTINDKLHQKYGRNPF